MADQDVSLVRVGFFSFLGNQQELVKQKESSFVFGSLQTKRSFKNQLSIANQVRAFPVGQEALDLLQQAQIIRSDGRLFLQRGQCM